MGQNWSGALTWEAGLSVYLVVAIDIKNAELYAEYTKAAGRALQPYRIERLSADRNPTMLEGSQPANSLAIIEFESREQLDEFWSSEAYREAAEIRRAASETKFIMSMKSIKG